MKLVLGYATGAVSIVSDGFQSLTDSASNVIGLVGMALDQLMGWLQRLVGYAD